MRVYPGGRKKPSESSPMVAFLSASMCDQIEGVASRDREEIKSDLKDGKREFKLLHQKIDRIMWALKLPPAKEKDEGDEL